MVGFAESRVRFIEKAMNADETRHRKIILKTLDTIYIVDLQHVTHIESTGCYSNIHLDSGEEILISKTLREFEWLLSNSGFFRIHKSYLINLSKIQRFERQEGGFVVLGPLCRIPVASRKREELMVMLGKLVSGFDCRP